VRRAAGAASRMGERCRARVHEQMCMYREKVAIVILSPALRLEEDNRSSFDPTALRDARLRLVRVVLGELSSFYHK
jgi:hypothetical protein